MRDMASQEQEPQQGPQPGHQDLGCRHPAPTALLDDEAPHLSGGQALEVQPASLLSSAQEQLGRAQVGGDGRVRQAPLAHQPPAVVLDQPPRRGASRGLRVAHHAEATQVGEQRSQRSLGEQDVALGTPNAEEVLRPFGCQIPAPQAPALQPAAQVRHQLQLAGCALPRITLPDQLCSEAVAVFGKRADHTHPPRISHHGPPLSGSVPVQGSLRQPALIMLVGSPGPGAMTRPNVRHVIARDIIRPRAYWHFHLARENHRVHTPRYQDTYDLAA